MLAVGAIARNDLANEIGSRRVLVFHGRAFCGNRAAKDSARRRADDIVYE
jgi:hypothetical protein